MIESKSAKLHVNIATQEIAIRLHQVNVSKVHHMRTVTMCQHALVRVLEGEKHIHAYGRTWKVAAPHWLLIAADTYWDLVNIPGKNGFYQAQMFCFTKTCVEQFHTRFPQFVQQTSMRSAEVLPRSSVKKSLQSAVEQMAYILQTHAVEVLGNSYPVLLNKTQEQKQDSTISVSVLNHRAEELLLLLAESGWMFGLPDIATDWSDRLRRRVAQQLNKEWTVPELAQTFHMSASSLQRRLAAENVSVAHLVREVRLGTALEMLQGSNLPVNEIAQRCGYGSHSRFSAAFKTRFGLPPSDFRIA
ncbi:helix-turn-helix transcriptional regulator [Undibacterium jejuense]|uniref:Helix-turn-helix transcriptional regulator n=1 Tax=Undibacterium jejuense TaxID=1344949 RepID=A0A923HD17_9BURK|nr:helix-turn-helix transcriptional regulator [Undibacterium jejuense]MBC3861766.1 helix-turn-helix transcriptional regulator [Undibacterium jejuense]